jgi:hypothetical protein
MSTKLFAIGLLLGCLLVGLGWQSQPQNKKWEYHMSWGLTTETANQLGQAGWELVTTAPSETNSPQVLYIFKRVRN